MPESDREGTAQRAGLSSPPAALALTEPEVSPPAGVELREPAVVACRICGPDLPCPSVLLEEPWP